MTIIDRDTRCVLSWDVVLEMTLEAMQACLERAPQAKQYYSEAFPVYDTLCIMGLRMKCGRINKKPIWLKRSMPIYAVI